MSLQESIEARLREALAPTHLEVHNESGRHNVAPGSETHFKVVVVSEGFSGRGLVERHRAIYGALGEAFGAGLHALAVHAYTPREWRAAGGGAPESPRCLGGKAREPA